MGHTPKVHNQKLEIEGKNKGYNSRTTPTKHEGYIPKFQNYSCLIKTIAYIDGWPTCPYKVTLIMNTIWIESIKFTTLKRAHKST